MLRSGIGVAHFGQPLYFCLRGQAPELRNYPTSTIVSFGFTISTFVVLVTFLGYGFVVVALFFVSKYTYNIGYLYD